MIALKKIDVYGQMVLIIGSIVYSCIKTDATIIYTYFLVGGWQVLSTALQLSVTSARFSQVKNRKTYEIFLVIATLTLPLGSYWLLLFIAPFTAIWYFTISFRELTIWEKRRLIQFK